MKNLIFAVCLVLTLTTSAMAWDWNGDPEGQKLDTEARHVLTTQNVCGVVIKADYLKGLYTKIDRHFAKDLDYPLFLRRSVLSANSEFLQTTEPADIIKNCQPRVEELRKLKLIVE